MENPGAKESSDDLAEQLIQDEQKQKKSSRMGDKASSILNGAVASMKAFGYSGMVKVTVSIVGISVFMGARVTREDGVGEVEFSGFEDKSSQDKNALKEAAENTDADEDEFGNKKTKKPGRMKRMTLSALKKARKLGFYMHQRGLSGFVGVEVAMKMFGTGVTIEFELELYSVISEIEFQEVIESKEEKEIEMIQKSGKGGKLNKKAQAQLDAMKAKMAKRKARAGRLASNAKEKIKDAGAAMQRASDSANEKIKGAAKSATEKAKAKKDALRERMNSKSSTLEETVEEKDEEFEEDGFQAAEAEAESEAAEKESPEKTSSVSEASDKVKDAAAKAKEAAKAKMKMKMGKKKSGEGKDK